MTNEQCVFEDLPENTAEAKDVEKKDEINLPVEITKLGDIKRSDYNPRKISQWALDALQKSMMKFGDLSGITVNVRTGRLVGGHQRLKHFDQNWRVVKQMRIKDDVGTVADGRIETPFGSWAYREVDWDETTEKAANIAANKHGGGWDIEKVKRLTMDIQKNDNQMVLFTGFDAMEMQNLGLGEKPAGKIEDAEYKMNRFLTNEIKQIVLYFEVQEYNKILARILEVMKHEKVDNNTEVFLRLLDQYEKNSTQPKKN